MDAYLTIKINENAEAGDASVALKYQWLMTIVDDLTLKTTLMDGIERLHKLTYRA